MKTADAVTLPVSSQSYYHTACILNKMFSKMATFPGSCEAFCKTVAYVSSGPNWSVADYMPADVSEGLYIDLGLASLGVSKSDYEDWFYTL